MNKFKPFKKSSISIQFFINYILLSILLVITPIIASLISSNYLNSIYNNYSIYDSDYYECINEYGLKETFELKKLPPHSYIEILDKNLTVTAEYNSINKVGYTYLQSNFYNLIINKLSEYMFFYPENEEKIIIVYLGDTYYPEDETIINVFKNTIIFSILGILIIMTLYAKFTSIFFVKPINKIVKGVEKISNGNYDIKINFKSKNELGQLRDAINKMSQIIKKEIYLKEKSENNRKQLILNISHDLKTPLTNILGYSETLYNMDELYNENKTKYLEIIISNSKKANHLIKDLFELSHLESNTYSFPLKDYDICEFVRKIFIEYIPQFDATNIKYEFDIPNVEINVRINPSKMERALSNIIDNGIKYSSDNTLIKTKIETIDKNVILTIEDNGLGIPINLYEDIFNPFVRFDPSRNSKTGGTGLGLSISKTIISLHGGTIKLDSSFKQGCRFIITLPTI